MIVSADNLFARIQSVINYGRLSLSYQLEQELYDVPVNLITCCLLLDLNAPHND